MRLHLNLPLLLLLLQSQSHAIPAHPAQRRSLSDLLSGLDLPGIDTIVDTGLDVLEKLIETLKGGQVSENGLKGVLQSHNGATNVSTTGPNASGGPSNNASCPTVALLFARGTGEPGNVGFLAGPPFFTALRNYLPNDTTTHLAVQGIPYRASVAGFLAGGDPAGAAFMARLAADTVAQCPNSMLALAGYSQGAQVVRDAVSAMPAALAAAVSSVVLFGDPRNGTAVAPVEAARVLTVCHAGDGICSGRKFVSSAHLNYSGDAPVAAMFVMQRSRLGLASKDATMQGMGNVPSMANPSGSA